MLRLLLPLLFMFAAADLAAGAWLEPQGRGFASASATLRNPGHNGRREVSFYGAYGLTPRLTVGLDLNSNDGLSAHALVFARLPLLDHSGHHLAAEFGLGVSQENGYWPMMQKLTLSYGRGLEAAGMQGWLAIDAATEARFGTSLWKLDATLGFNRPGKPAPLLQIETAKAPGERLYYTVTPSLRLPLKGGREMLVGLEYRQTRQRSLGLKIGLWQRF